MAKISIDLKTSSGDLPEKEIISPTKTQVSQVFHGALLTIDLIGKAAEHLEVIKISFDQRCLDSTHTKAMSELVLRMTAIMSNWRDKDDKFEACVAITPSRYGYNVRGIARELLVKINMAITARIANGKSLTESWEQALRTSIGTSDAILAKWYPAK